MKTVSTFAIAVILTLVVLVVIDLKRANKL